MISTAKDTIGSESEWMPSAIDFNARSVEFMRVPSSQLVEPGFLFEYQPNDPADRLAIPFDAIGEIDVETGPVHFVFHSAFCRSTLLVRALNIEGVSMGMSEPGIIAALASGGPQAAPLIAPLLRILGRRRDGAAATFIKPTNHANRLIPGLLDACPGAKAVLMTNPVEPFLKSVRKRGLMGHRWGRRLYLEMQSYAGLDLGMPPDEVFAMTDLQAAGVAWLMHQAYFTSLLGGPHADRLRTLDGDYFDRHRGETIGALLGFCCIDDPPQGSTLADSPAFAQHSKLGGEVLESEPDKHTAEEIGQVRQWLDMIGSQMQLDLPVKQTLL